MNEQDAIAIIETIVYDHPEWLTSIQRAITSGITVRLAYEQQLRANQEVALSMAYDVARYRLNRADKKTVLTALCNTAMFSGTPYEAQLRKELETLP